VSTAALASTFCAGFGSGLAAGFAYYLASSCGLTAGADTCFASGVGVGATSVAGFALVGSSFLAGDSAMDFGVSTTFAGSSGGPLTFSSVFTLASYCSSLAAAGFTSLLGVSVLLSSSFLDTLFS